MSADSTEQLSSAPRPASGRWSVLGIVTLCYAAVGISVGAIPAAVTHNGGDNTAVGIAMGAYAFTAIGARIVFGFAMRRTGYRVGLAIAALLIVTGSATSATPVPEIIIAGRLILGVGVGAMMATSTAWIVELPSAANHTARSIGSIGTVNYAVLALGTPVGSWLTTQRGPLTALLVSAGFPLIATILLLVMRAPAVPAIDSDVTLSSDSRRTITAASLGPGISLMLSGFGYAAIVSFGAQLCAERGIGHGAAVVVTYGLAMVITRVLLGPITDRLSRPTPTAIAFLLEGVGICAISLAHTGPLLFTGVLIVGASMALIYPMLGAQVADRSGPLRGTALSVYGAFINLGIGVGSVVMGAMVQNATLTTAFAATAAIVLIGGLTTMAFTPRTSAPHHHDSSATTP